MSLLGREVYRHHAHHHPEENTAMRTFDLTFDRIGRRRDVAPLVVTVTPKQDDWPGAPDTIAAAVHRYAKGKLMSREYMVEVDLDAGRGVVVAGGRTSGEFAITERTPEGAQS